MDLHRACLALTALLVLVSTGARADGITAAQYLEPISRYGHFIDTEGNKVGLHSKE